MTKHKIYSMSVAKGKAMEKILRKQPQMLGGDDY